MAEDSRSFQVPYGTNLTITAEPDTGYELVQLKYGEEEINSGDSKTVTADVTVSASWTAIIYNISVSAGNGTITVNDGSEDHTSDFTAAYGTELTVTVEAGEHEVVSKVLVNGSEINNGGKVTVSGETTITAEYAPDEHIVSVADGMDFDHVTVTVGGQQLSEGSTLTFTHGEEVAVSIAFEEGYEGTLMVDGEEHTSGENITITDDVVISWSASLKQITIYVAASDHGVIKISDGTTTYSAGDWQV